MADNDSARGQDSYSISIHDNTVNIAAGTNDNIDWGHYKIPKKTRSSSSYSSEDQDPNSESDSAASVDSTKKRKRFDGEKQKAIPHHVERDHVTTGDKNPYQRLKPGLTDEEEFNLPDEMRSYLDFSF